MSSPFDEIAAVDYTVIMTRDMQAMRSFYEGIMGFKLERALSENWFEYRVGQTILALSNPGLTASDAPVPDGSAALQLAFKVPVATVDRCADVLRSEGVPIVSPPKDQSFGHRTLFFRDPDGNLLEIYAEN